MVCDTWARILNFWPCTFSQRKSRFSHVRKKQFTKIVMASQRKIPVLKWEFQLVDYTRNPQWPILHKIGSKYKKVGWAELKNCWQARNSDQRKESLAIRLSMTNWMRVSGSVSPALTLFLLFIPGLSLFFGSSMLEGLSDNANVRKREDIYPRESSQSLLDPCPYARKVCLAYLCEWTGHRSRFPGFAGEKVAWSFPAREFYPWYESPFFEKSADESLKNEKAHVIGWSNVVLVLLLIFRSRFVMEIQDELGIGERCHENLSASVVPTNLPTFLPQTLETRFSMEKSPKWSHWASSEFEPRGLCSPQ